MGYIWQITRSKHSENGHRVFTSPAESTHAVLCGCSLLRLGYLSPPASVAASASATDNISWPPHIVYLAPPTNRPSPRPRVIVDVCSHCDDPTGTRAPTRQSSATAPAAGAPSHSLLTASRGDYPKWCLRQIGSTVSQIGSAADTTDGGGGEWSTAVGESSLLGYMSRNNGNFRKDTFDT